MLAVLVSCRSTLQPPFEHGAVSVGSYFRSRGAFCSEFVTNSTCKQVGPVRIGTLERRSGWPEGSTVESPYRNKSPLFIIEQFESA